MIRLLEDCEYVFTDQARRDGLALAARLGTALQGVPTESGLVDYIIDKLKGNFPLTEVPLGEPPGSLGVGFTMTRTDGQSLYIKLKIEDECVFILSFHDSKHT